MLIHRESGSIILNLKDPARVTNVIPTAKSRPVPGGETTLVVVPHKEDEVRVLRNLEFDVPAPIESYYDWPCAYPGGPFAHQKTTAAFLAMNKRAYCLNGMGCIAGDERVLVSRKSKSYETTLAELHAEFHSLPDKDAWRVQSLKGDRFGMHTLLDVVHKGVKPTLRITLECGRAFRCTRDHRIARPDGSWTEAGDLSLGDDLVTNGAQAYARPKRGETRPREQAPRRPVVILPSSSRVVSIETGGDTDVYDLCMEAPHHNFVINGVVVHNSGKTLSTLWAFDYMRKRGLAKRMLVIAPLSTLDRTWADEVFTHLPHLTTAVLHGSADRRLKLLAVEHDIYIVNHDGVKIKALLEALRARTDIDIVAYDELAVCRMSSSARFKATRELLEGRKYVWGLTGTPTPNAPTDAWAQCRLITPWTVSKYFGHFRDDVMKQVSPFKWVPRSSALAHVSRAMQPAIRFSREECIDLPPTTYVTREVPLTKEQRTAFDDMLKKLHAEYDGGQIQAVNEAVKLGKLLQILAGVAYGSGGEEITLPCEPRIDVVREVIEEAEAKVIVFVPFTGALKHLAAELSKSFSVEMVYGDVTKNDRSRIFADFQKRPDPRVLVADARTMSHGLNLIAGNTIVWYGPTTSTETYLQANERICRPGQKHNTLIVHIESTPVERSVYDRLRRRSNMQGALLDLLKGER